MPTPALERPATLRPIDEAEKARAALLRLYKAALRVPEPHPWKKRALHLSGNGYSYDQSVVEPEPAKAEPRLVEEGHYKVDSATYTLHAYDVRFEGGEWTCTCPGFYYRHTCSHVRRLTADL